LGANVILRLSFLLLLLAIPALSQNPSQWDFLSTSSIYPDVHNMLPAYLKAHADTLIEQRRQGVAGMASLQDLQSRQRKWRERMWSDLGGQPERTPLNARTVGVLDRGDYRIEKVIFESRPGFYVTANLYLPKQGNGPYPAIVYPLGHEDFGKAYSAWQQTLASLASRGFVCLTWDPVGQGERIQFYDEDWHDSKLVGSTTEHTTLGLQSLLLGTHIAQYTIWDGIRALDYLLSRPEVDSKRVGCTGNSGGGTHTAYLSGLDDRIQVAAPSCYITSWRRLLESIGPQDAEQVFPFWLKDGFDFPDFIYATAGKPFLVLSAIRDFFPIDGARASFEEVRGVYGKLGLSENVAMFEADDGHGYTPPRREMAYRWFTRWLQGSENKQPESPVTLASVQELQCTATGQVKTAFPGSADVHSINRELAARLASARKLSPDQVRSRALELTHYEPRQAPLGVRSYGRTVRAGLTVEKLTYESEPGIDIPSLLFVPGNGNSKLGIILLDARGKSASVDDAEVLARAGNVVLVPDLRGFGETQPGFVRHESRIGDFGDYRDSMTALLEGKTMPGMRALDIIRGVDLLASRSEINPARIGAIGRDAAAIPLLYAALFDRRISSLAVSGMLSSYDSAVSEKFFRGLADQVVPSALKYFDLPDVIAAIAPRRMAIFNGVNPLGQALPVERMQEQYARSSAAYNAAGAPRSLQLAVQNEAQEPIGAALIRWTIENNGSAR
jgi:cephalosporin-C deacetylase-like acetyl esterase